MNFELKPRLRYAGCFYGKLALAASLCRGVAGMVQMRRQSARLQLPASESHLGAR